jgi:hypothetical protein
VVTTWLTAVVVRVTPWAVVVATACAVEVKVETRVTRTVEVVLLTTVDRTVDPASVWVSVAVTGQIVVDSSMMTVVTTSLTAGVEVATAGLLTGVVTTPALEEAATTADEVETIPAALLVEVWETGTMLVETATETVVNKVERAGQLVTSGPQLIMVEIKVVKSVTVLKLTAADEVTATETGVVVDSTTEDVSITELEVTTAEVEVEVVVCPRVVLVCSRVVLVCSTWDTEVVVA